MKRLVVIRPEPGCETTVAAASAMGLEAHGFPLFEVRAVAWEPPDAARFDALLIGSGNAIRHGGPALSAYRALPVHAVGETTAREARAAGFTDVRAGNGGLQPVLDNLPPEHKRLLRLAGRERTKLTPPPGVTIEERVVYESAPLPLPGGLAELLREPCVVLLHSGEAARHFAAQCELRQIARKAIAVAALAPRIAEAVGGGWAEVRSAATAQDQALLALAQVMCQTAANS